MQLDDVLRTSAMVQAVDVLRHQREVWEPGFPVG